MIRNERNLSTELATRSWMKASTIIFNIMVYISITSKSGMIHLLDLAVHLYSNLE